MKNSSAIIGLAFGFAVTSVATAAPSVSPEQDTLEISKKLKPVSNEKWQEIVGERTTEQYEVVGGDSLWDISKRLFGDGNYWPKVWSLNNGTITNPHLIRPGKTVAFSPGTRSSLPSVAIDQLLDQSREELVADNSAAPSGVARKEEWKQLPPNQTWEVVQLAVDSQVDPGGFDRRSKVSFHEGTGLELKSILSSDRIKPRAVIKAGTTPANRLGAGDRVYLAGGSDLKIGGIYTISRAPDLLSSPDRSTFVYRDLGTLKVTESKSDVFVAEIIASRDYILRDDIILDFDPKVTWPKLIPGHEPLKAHVILDPNDTVEVSAQHLQVYLDRGTSDGISAGMVFRAYQYRDPANDEEITSESVVKESDILVLKTYDRTSVGLIIHSEIPIKSDREIQLLTDIRDVRGYDNPDAAEPAKKPVTPEATKPEELPPDVPGETTTEEAPPDDLDQLDDGGNLSDQEKKEIDQLENYKEPVEAAPPTTDELPPVDDAAPSASPEAPAEAPASPEPDTSGSNFFDEPPPVD